MLNQWLLSINITNDKTDISDVNLCLFVAKHFLIETRLVLSSDKRIHYFPI
jgi:hypothetical protein